MPTRSSHRCRGADLAGWTYEPLFPYFADRPDAFRVLADDFVSHRGRHRASCTWPRPTARTTSGSAARRGSTWSIRSTRAARSRTRCRTTRDGSARTRTSDIIRRLKDEGKLVHQSTIVHSYPFCERTDTPLIYRAIDAWYVRVEDLRDDLAAANEEVHWVPGLRGRETVRQLAARGEGLEHQPQPLLGLLHPGLDRGGRVGHDLRRLASPSWRSCPGGARRRPAQAHRGRGRDPSATARPTAARRRCWTAGSSRAPCPTRSSTTRSSGRTHSSPSSRRDFIAEGLDQTRGWFYTLLVLSTALFGRSRLPQRGRQRAGAGRGRPQDEQAAQELPRPARTSSRPTARTRCGCT